MEYQVLLMLEVEAETYEKAEEIGQAALDHLADTFNDEDNLSPMGVQVSLFDENFGDE